LDRALFERAQARLVAEGRAFGYGTARGATVDWDGEHDAFSQFVPDAALAQLRGRTFGAYADVFEFYDQVDAAHDGGWGTRLLFRFAAADANRRIEALRAGTSPTSSR
jgi:hypothetical protein